jgi:hypothetical protein
MKIITVHISALAAMLTFSCNPNAYKKLEKQEIVSEFDFKEVVNGKFKFRDGVIITLADLDISSFKKIIEKSKPWYPPTSNPPPPKLPGFGNTLMFSDLSGEVSLFGFSNDAKLIFDEQSRVVLKVADEDVVQVINLFESLRERVVSGG